VHEKHVPHCEWRLGRHDNVVNRNPRPRLIGIPFPAVASYRKREEIADGLAPSWSDARRKAVWRPHHEGRKQARDS
jgi:hypothetical protein